MKKRPRPFARQRRGRIPPEFRAILVAIIAAHIGETSLEIRARYAVAARRTVSKRTVNEIRRRLRRGVEPWPKTKLEEAA